VPLFESEIVPRSQSLPSDEATGVLLFTLVANGQMKLRRIGGWRKIAAILSHGTVATA
jgi:hypothetical protein